MILTLPRTQAPLLPHSGCWPVSSLAFLQPPLWRVRADVEHDETLLQPIVYLLLRNPAGQVWCYQRTESASLPSTTLHTIGPTIL